MIQDETSDKSAIEETGLSFAGSPARKALRYVILLLSIVFSAYSLIEVNMLNLPPFQQRALFLMFPLALCFLVAAHKSKASLAAFQNLLNFAFAGISIVTCAYIVFEYDGLLQRMGAATSTDLVIAGLAVIVVFESTRRLTGLALPVIAGVFVAYAYWGDRLPTWLGGHAGYDINRILTQSFLTMEGVFGVAISVMFTYVFPFVLFGVVLEAIGGLGFAIDLAQAIFGRFRGGSAKVAVVASGMVGLISGSAVANVVTAGSLTIPMMKKTGFQGHVAGAIEAVASTGGQLMPPVMGAAAFMMAEFLGVPYLTIAKAALIPALLYYLALFTTIHFYAVRHDLGGLAEPNQGRLILTILKRTELYLFVLPVGTLIYFMLSGLSTTKSVTYALGVAFATSLFVNGRRLTPRRLVKVLEKSAQDSISLCAASACVGVIIGLTLMTALGARFTSIILDMSGGSTYAALFLIMIASVILGLGLPTTVCYVLLATLAAPALIQLGIDPIAAHMFILYFGMMSMVTPPDAMAAYAGAMIAGADMMKTGFTAWVFSLAGYLLPFMFVLNPATLMLGSIPAILEAAFMGVLGVMALGVAVAGHMRAPLKIWERGALFAAAVSLIHPAWYTDLLGIVLIGTVVMRQYSLRSLAPVAHSNVS